MWKCCFLCAAAMMVLEACTFNYNEAAAKEYSYPEISFEHLAYTRVRNGKRVAQLEAEHGDQYESKHTMKVKQYHFEQYEEDNGAVDATGEGGEASVDMRDNDATMTNGVTIMVKSEDYSLHSSDLRWDDKQKHLSSGDTSPVHITRSDGTVVNGAGLSADVRARTWEFKSNVSGTYIMKKDKSTGKDTKQAEPAK